MPPVPPLVVRSWFTNVATAISVVMPALVGALMVADLTLDPQDRDPGLADYLASAEIVVALTGLAALLMIRSLRMGAFFTSAGLQVRGLIVTKTIPWQSIIAIDAPYVPNYVGRGRSYQPQVTFRTASGRPWTTTFWMLAAARDRIASERAEMFRVWLRLAGGPYPQPTPPLRPLAAEDVVRPGRNSWWSR
jgi:hypothetical protein